jgi:hypothetical protein
MERNEQVIHSPFVRASNPQLIILTQLMQVSKNVHHIDEVLAWLTYMFVKHLDVQVMQIWANQTSSTGQVSLSLRAIAYQDASLPEHIVCNGHVAEVAGRLLRERPGSLLQLANGSFSLHQTNLLRRYGLNSWFGYALGGDALLPLTNELFSGREVAKPFNMVALLFLRQALPQVLISTTNRILEQLVPIAQYSHLLLAPAISERPSLPSTPVLQSPSSPSPAQLIPQRVLDGEAMRSRNPFASMSVISDKQASRLYLAIDGRKNLAELLSLTRLGQREFEAALRLLLMQKLIQLVDAAGQPLEFSLFLNHP